MSFFEYLGQNYVYLIIVLAFLLLVVIASLIKPFILRKFFNKKSNSESKSENSNEVSVTDNDDISNVNEQVATEEKSDCENSQEKID